MNPLLLVDFYKPHHNPMYPEGMTLLYSNLTPRKSRIPGINEVVFFGLQHLCLEYLIKKFNEEFFGVDPSNEFKYKVEFVGYSNEKNPFAGLPNEPDFLPLYKKIKRSKEEILDEYQRHIGIDVKHLNALHDLQYLPIEIKAVPEGTLVPIGVPCFTIKNTHPEFAWLTNYLETLISTMLWQPTTSATLAHKFKKLVIKYALETTGTTEGVQWQGHDFSMRGMSSVESAILSGMGHLLSFTGTDTIPAIYQLEKSYFATGLIGASVPATEHSVMCMGKKESEIDTFRRLLNLYPTGILSVVSDTWDLWKVLTEYLPILKEEILARDGKLVIRPDSGDPVDIICGRTKPANELDNTAHNVWYKGEYYEDRGGPRYFKHMIKEKSRISPVEKGVIELLWDAFGGTVNELGYKVLNPHIGAIYGDSITPERAEQIFERLKAKGFASTNIVLGIGSYTYQYNTRDTFGFAMKATYGEITHGNNNPAEGPVTGHGYVEAREIFKDPITDDGTKKSAKGLLQVYKEDGKLRLKDQCTKEEEKLGLLETVFKNGVLVKTTTLEEIRKRLANN